MAAALLSSRAALAAVDVLGAGNLSAVTATGRHLVAFCTEWSPHCHVLLPEMRRAADTLVSKGADVTLAVVQSGFEEDTHEPVGSMLWYERGGIAHAYVGGRTAERIVQWVLARLGDAPQPSSEASKDELR